MLDLQIALNDPSISPLIENGYQVEVRNGHLLVLNVPYVNSAKVVNRGIIVCNLGSTSSPLGIPPHHQAWFIGEIPCYATGELIYTPRKAGSTWRW
jgi:hypothetical protein